MSRNTTPREASRGQRRRHLWLVTIATIVAVLLIVGVAGWNLLNYVAFSHGIDYSTRPPDEVFQIALGQKIPKGIKELRYAGHSGAFGIHTLIWMRFRFDESALRALLTQREPLTAEQAQQQLVFPSEGFRHVESDKASVNWHEVASIKHPEYFQTGSSDPNSSQIWLGVLIVDRKRGVAFVYVDGN